MRWPKSTGDPISNRIETIIEVLRLNAVCRGNIIVNKLKKKSSLAFVAH